MKDIWIVVEINHTSNTFRIVDSYMNEHTARHSRTVLELQYEDDSRTDNIEYVVRTSKLW
jgi:hypothetical protein